MMKNNIVLRIDALSRKKQNKDLMFRIVKTPSGVVAIDTQNHIQGRGVYLSKDKNTILKAKEKKILQKSLKCDVNEGIYDDLIRLL